MTDEQIIDARNWILDCGWGPFDSLDVDELTDAEVISGIARNYAGGIDQFILDGGF